MKKEEHFNTSEKRKPAQRQPMQLGLYAAANEHDACGVGMLVNIHGGKSHELVEAALKVLENMRHRGAEGADNKTCLLYTSPSPRDRSVSRMPSSA